MPLYHDKNWWFNFFKKKTHATGNVLLPSVDKHRKIHQVFLHADPGSSMPVCHGDINYLGCVNRDHEFTIYANINSSYAHVHWIVKFDEK